MAEGWALVVVTEADGCLRASEQHIRLQGTVQDTGFQPACLSPFLQKNPLSSGLPSVSRVPRVAGRSQLSGSRSSSSAGLHFCRRGARAGSYPVGQNLSTLSGTAKEQRCNCRFSWRSGEMENSCYK